TLQATATDDGPLQSRRREVPLHMWPRPRSDVHAGAGDSRRDRLNRRDREPGPHLRRRPGHLHLRARHLRALRQGRVGLHPDVHHGGDQRGDLRRRMRGQPPPLRGLAHSLVPAGLRQGHREGLARQHR
ncbi:hypothetical protein AAVH_40960, partial [Aphelenchoides avenae]